MKKKTSNLIYLLSLLTILSGCTNGNVVVEEGDILSKPDFLFEHGLSNQYKINEYKNPRIENKNTISKSDKDEILFSKDDLQTYIDNQMYNASKRETLKAYLDEDFDKYNLLVTITYHRPYESIINTFEGLYLKEDVLYIHLLNHDNLGENMSVDCVCGEEFFTVFIDKNITFSSINRIIESEARYR